MTRLFAASFAVFALALGACERHPLPGQSEVTHTHGSNGAHEEAHGAADAAHGSAAKHEEKKVETAHPAPGTHEEAPKFFPDKK
jgi:hypothetical protein